MRKVIESVGGSIGWARNGVSTDGSHSVSATVAWVMPAMATMSPASAWSTPVRSRPRKASTFVTRAFSISSPSRLIAFIVWLGLSCPRDAAGEDAAEVGVGLERGRQHAERPLLDRRRRHVGHDSSNSGVRSLLGPSGSTAIQPSRPEP